MTALERDLVQSIKKAAEAMNAFVAVVGQQNSKKAGTTLGFPDLCLFCAGHVVLIELKRCKADDHPAGVLSLGQQVFIERAAEQGVKVHVVDDLQSFVNIVNACRRPR